MAEVIHDGHGLKCAREMGNGFELICAFINATVEPVDDGIATRLGVVEVLHADDVARGGEIDFDGIVATAEGVPGDVAAVGLTAPDATGEGGIDRGAVLLFHIVSLAAMAPIKPSIGMEEGAVDIGGISGVIESTDDHFTLIGDSVVVGVGELPQAGRGTDVE